MKDKGNWNCQYKLEKYKQDISSYSQGEEEGLFYTLFQPYEVKEGEGNCLLNEGINLMWDLVTGAGGTAYGTNSRLGVGNGTAAADGTQTALQGTTTTFAAMEAGYPTSTTQKATFKSSFGSGTGDHVWAEWTVDNGSADNKNLNRKVEALGTKSGGTWTLEVSVTLS